MRIGIIGAGIGGLVAAAALQADGHEVIVTERRDDAGSIGAGLTLFSNAFAALDAIGLGETVREVSSTAVGRLRSGQRQPPGRWLVSLPPSETPTVRSLLRADLHHALVNLLEPGSLRLGCSVRASADGSPVLHVNGQEERFDLVVAADGIRSDARARWGLDRGIRYAGYTAWRGITSSSGHLADEAGETWGRGARFGIVPLPDERVYWFATRTTPSGRTDTNAQETLLRLFGSWHAPISELIEATAPDAILRHDIYDLARFPTSFVHHRGVLVGDAAHAMTPDLGQGAGQAIEDAATLTLLLRGAEARDLGPILERYDQLRRSRTRGLWRQSRLTGRVAQAANPLAARLRDTGLRAVPSSLTAGAMSKMQQWRAPEPRTPGSGRSRTRAERGNAAEFVVERETTPVSVRVRGHGPGVILVPGGMQTAADFDRLATTLASTFTTIVLDRRGRGASRHLAPAAGLDAEAEDVLQVAEALGARHMFGLSSGALIALRAAQLNPNMIRSIALYEPPLATPGYEEEFDWTKEVANLLERGENTSALTKMIAVVGDHWAIRLIPQSLLRIAAAIALRWGRGAGGERISELLPTFHEDARIVTEAPVMLSHLASVTSRVLLMNGSRAAGSLLGALRCLDEALPQAGIVELKGSGHLSASNGGRPESIADALRDFFAQDAGEASR